MLTESLSIFLYNLLKNILIFLDYFYQNRHFYLIKHRFDNSGMYSNNLNYELGFGFEFYLYYFKFSPSLRGLFSFQNELVNDNDPDSPWTGKILNMFSRGVAIIITFE